MAQNVTNKSNNIATLGHVKVYSIAVACLMTGLAIGYGITGLQAFPWPRQSSAQAASTTAGGSTTTAARTADQDIQTLSGTRGNAGAPASPHRGAMAPGGHMPSLDELKQMADQQAEPLLVKLKSDPKNATMLVQVGAIYHSTHQFKQAALYYGKAVQADPKNVATRTKLATSLYRDGDADGAIAQLNLALSYDSKDANALFNLGVIRLQGKQDGKGAVAAWQRLLKTNPQLSSDRKAAVQKLMAEVLTTLGDQHRSEGVRKNGQADRN